MKSQVRSFIAVEISSQIRASIARWLKRRVIDADKVKWVAQDQFHLTLKFLGDVPMNEMHHVIGAVKTACQTVEPFDLVFEGIGAFPNELNPHSLWVGVTEGIEESSELAERIDAELAKLGFPREVRKFTPHLTIGRVKQAGQKFRRRPSEGEAAGLDSFLALDGETPFFGLSAVDGVTLFSSELSRTGPKYDVLAEIDLRSEQ